MKAKPSAILITVVFGFMAFLPKGHAVVPGPDGCYPNYTTAEGCSALNFLSTGAGNTGVGWYALYLDTTGSFNTGVGGGALALNNADSNTAVGAAALLLNTTGIENVALGTDALVYNDSGSHNSALGAFALFSNTTGVNNVAVGTQALSDNIDAHDNTAVGFQSLASNQGGINAGNWNTATGSQALYSNTIGRFNCGFGVQALFNSDNGEENNAFGYRALYNNHSVTGAANSAFGTNALLSNVGGQQNSAFGNGTLFNNVSGVRNTAIGLSAGSNIDGDGNVCIGALVLGEAGVSDSTYIRNVNTLAQPIVGGIDGVTVRLSDGRLGHGVSSRRYKQDIKPMDKASEALYALKPVTFHYNKEIDPMQTLDFGLIAEEVAKVNPELAVRDAEGKISNYRRDAINAMLLNEFLKEHRRNEEQQATIAELKSELQAVKGLLEQQAAQIHKVSAQLDLNQSTARTVSNNQ